MTAAIDAQPLSTQLKTATAQAHEDAEHSAFMTELIGGGLGAPEFIAYQEQSWLFYTALEQAAHAVADGPRAGRIVDPRLDRADRLDHDLTVLHGSAQWKETLAALPATQRYVDRLHDIAAAGDEIALLAHHYVRYLGDLSGGQVIARMMQRHYDIPADALTFYDFSQVGKLKPYKDSYRDHLNELTLSDEERDRLLAEARWAFHANMDVFADLAAHNR